MYSEHLHHTLERLLHAGTVSFHRLSSTLHFNCYMFT